MEPTKPSHGKDNSDVMKMGEQVEPKGINKLPPEIINLIISENKNDQDLKSSSEVNRVWNKETIAIVNNEFPALQSFITDLFENIPMQCIDQKNALIDLKVTKILDSVNINEIKSSLNKLKEQILNILKTLEKEDLESLKNDFKGKVPSTFSNAFDIAIIYQNLDESLKNMPRELAIKPVAYALAELGLFDKAVELLDTIPDRSRAYTSYSRVAETAGSSGNLFKAIEVYQKIPLEDDWDTDYFKYLANSLPDTNLNKSVDLYILCDFLAKHNQLDDAKEIATTIPNEEVRNRALENFKNI